MNRLKKLSLVLVAIATGTLAFAQKDLVISGGSKVSSLVCGNNDVYVTGSNKAGQNPAGQLGTGSTAEYVSTWTKVDFPNDADGGHTTMQQVNSGSGEFFIALDCKGQAWAWGDNGKGQTGTGTSGGSVNTPKQVKAGAAAGTDFDDGHGNLANVKLIYAGNENGYALLNDGRLMAWGAGNGYGGMGGNGDGSSTDRTSPVFVKTKVGNQVRDLENVTAVYSGDCVTLALVDDDGDGKGTVYSFGGGKNGTLGRNANGSVWTSDGAGLYAQPVMKTASEPLSNIVAIACGDVFGVALDADGYVWTWGNDGWHGCCGWGGTLVSGVPAKVIAGNTTGASNDGTYLLAKYIGAGQSMGMAITADDKPVVWGKFEDGPTTQSCNSESKPSYVEHDGPGKVHDNVILINKGDRWGFYGLSDGSMWAWGCNEVGQLGNNGNTDLGYAQSIKLVESSGCTFKDPPPVATLPNSKFVCASAYQGETLDCKFKVSAANLLSKYQITWYKDGVKVQEGNATKTTYKTKAGEQGLGVYKVVAKYIGTNTGCTVYDSVEASMTISAYEKNYDVDDFTFCNGTVTTNVTTQNENAQYSWFSNANGSGLLGQSVGNASVSLDVSELPYTNTQRTQKTIYVQETALGTGTLLPNKPSGSNGVNQKFASIGLDISGTTTVTSTSVCLMPGFQTSYLSGSTYSTEEEANQPRITTGTATITVTVYGVKKNQSGAFVANTSNVEKRVSKSVNFSCEEMPRVEYHSWEDKYQPIWQGGNITLPAEIVEIPLDITFDAGIHYFSVSISTTGLDVNNTKLCEYQTNMAGTVDNLNGNVTVYGAEKDGNMDDRSTGPFYNFQLSSGQGYCDIIPVTLTEDCPCNKPGEFTVVATDDKTYLCPDETTTLKINRTKAADNAAKVGYKWYKGTTELTDEEGKQSISVDVKGKYKLMAYDIDNPSSGSCQYTANLEVTEAPKPTVTIGNGGAYCEGKTVNDISLTFTGTAPFTYSYTENGGTAKNGTAAGTSGKITPATTVAAGSASTDYVYKITSLKDKYCTADANNSTSTVTIVAVPTAEITASKDEVCAPESIALTASSNITGATFKWAGDGSGTGDTQTADGAKSYTYKLTATNTAGTASCPSAEVSKTVVINAKPVVTLSSDKDAVCSGNEITVTATAKVNGQAATGGTYTWSGATGTGATATAKATATWPDAEVVSVYADYESAAGCKADRPTALNLTFNPKPVPPTESNKSSYCMNPSASDVTLEATPANNRCTLQWYKGDGTTKLNAAPSISIKSDGTYNYKVTQLFEGCESDPTDISIIVNKKLQPKIIISHDELCINGTSEVTVEDANRYTVTWSGDAVSGGFGVVSGKNLDITAPSVTAKTEYNIHVKVENAECDGENDATITVHPTPKVTLAADDDDICVGEVATITATVTGDDGDGTTTWTNATEKALKTAELTGENTGTTDKTVSISYAYVSSHSCPADVVSTNVTVRAVPVAPTTAAYTKCIEAAEESLDAYVTRKVGTLNWYGTNATGGEASSTAPIGKTDQKIVPAVNYYVSQTVNGCEGPRAALPVTVNANLEPQIIAEESSVTANDGAVCAGTAITLSTAGGYAETWTMVGEGSSYLQVTSNSKTFLGTAPAGTYVVKVNVVDENSCTGESTRTLVVNPIPTTTVAVGDPDHCISVDAAQTITATPSENGTGTWGGTVITNSTNTTTAFVPSSNTAGDHVITYDFTSDSGCVAQQSSLTMTVFPLPTPQVIVSNKVVCHDGTTNTAPVTVTTKNTAANGTFVYSINNGTVNTATGEFDPTANDAGDYEITLTYTDGNGCVNTAIDNFTVYNKPTVDIIAPAEACYNAAAKTLTPDVAPTGGTGTWSGTAAATSASFDPASYHTGDNTVGYTYTDPNGCTNSNETTINVVKVDAPTTSGTSTVMINLGVILDGSSSTMSATAADASDVLQWFLGENGSAGTQVGADGDASYTKEVNGTSDEGAYPYTVRSYRMVDGAKCYSDSAIARVVITKCSAMSPQAEDIYICANTENPSTDITASRNAASTISDADSYIAWFNVDPVGKDNATAEAELITDIDVDTKTLSANVPNASGLNTKEIGDYSFYAAEYDKTGHCWSAGTKVTVHVVDTPSVVITAKSDYCAHGDVTVPIEVMPRIGTLAFSGADAGTINGLVWTPGDYDGSQLTGKFVYTVTSSAYADGTTCTSAPEFSVNAHYMAPTDGSTTNWLIKLADQIPALPSYTADASKPANDQPVTWYSDKNKSTKIGDDNVDKTYAVGDMTATVAGLETYDVSYWVTRTKVVSNDLSCESEPAEVKLILAECPWAAPDVDNIVICSEDALPNLEATPGDLSNATAAGVTGWRWVNATAGTQEENTNSSYATALPNEVTETTVTTFKVSYKAAEKMSQAECWSPEKTVTVTVNALPVVAVDLIGTSQNGGEIGILCYDGGDFMATATANGVRAEGGQWSVTELASLIDENSGIINPTLSKDNGEPADGNYTAHFEYTDGNGCKNTAERAFTVEYAEIPTTEKYVGMTSNPIPVVLEAGNIANGNDKQIPTVVSWYRTETSRNELSDNANPWTVDESIINPAEQTEGEGIELYVSQTVNGCVSERKKQEVMIVDCPWTVETVTDAETCEGIAFADGMGATANAGATPTKWSWSASADVLNEIPGEEGAESTYSQSDVASAGVTTYYVRYYAYYDKGQDYCWSAPREVTSTVHSNPVVTFNAEDPASVCFTDGDSRVRVVVTPGNNGQGVSNAIASTQWSTSGSDDSFSTQTETYAYFNTLKQAQETDEYTITVKAEDVKGCKGENERTIKVIYLPKPTTEGFYAMTSQTNDVVVKVSSDVADGASIHWFDYEAGMTPDVRKNKNDNGDGATWSTGLPYDREIEKTYYARQYDGSADCYSEAAEALVRLVPCPIPNVNIDAPVACVYDVAGGAAVMTATTGDWSERDGSKSEFRFYTSNDATDFVTADENGKYDPKDAVATANVYSYYVSEYNALPLEGLTNPEGCEGRKVKTTVTINETLAPTITPATDAVCDGQTDKLSFKATFNGMGSGAIWFEEDPGAYGVPAVDGSPVQMTFSPTGSEPNEYTIYAVRYENGCYSEKASATYTIKPIPDAPELEGAEICFEESNVPVTAVNLEEGDVINWYSDDKATRPISKNTVSYLSKESEADEYTYYATRTVNGCESSLKMGGVSSVVYTIKPLPLPPQVDYKQLNCEYDEPVTMKALNPLDNTVPASNVKWYNASDLTTSLNEEYADVYTVDKDVMTAGIKRFFATQTVNGCEGPTKLISFNVYAKPESPKVTGASICQGDTIFPTLSTNMSIDMWWSDSLMSTQIDKGYTHTPHQSEVGNSDVTYYVTRTQNGCTSDTVPVTLRVIPTPTFTISDDITLCIYDDIAEIKAENFNPEINDASTVMWNAGRTDGVMRGVTDGVDHTIVPYGIVTEATDYTISATYKYVSDGIFCVSEPISMHYKLIDRARKPIVFSKIICQGSEIKDLQALGSQHVVWKSLDGTLPEDFHGPKYKFQPGQVLDTGTYRFEIYDLNIYSLDEEDETNSLGCMSIVDTVSLVVAPGAHTKLFGRDSVCMGATGETYYTQYSENSQYFWTVTGNNLNYSKDAMSTSVRYIDWLEPGVDTLTVYEQTWAGCEGFDTLIVKIAPAPIAHYNWTMPGSSNVIELKDSTVQDSLWTTDDNGEPLAMPIEYTMAWNYGHQGSDPSEIDTLIPFNQRNFPIHEGGYLYGYNCPILTVTNDFGCTDSYTECVFVNLSSSLYVPTAFSPTNPAHAVRTFQPKGFNLQTCEISVYD
ncbi:MAG: hypothetical protein IKO90_10285, partial [Bacteroidales bacterium]|nr:hypothetical protein [Bacteroidales bacterium]